MQLQQMKHITQMQTNEAQYATERNETYYANANNVAHYEPANK
jgi:hypothetical protein